jgi:hypothetical protein
MEPSQVTTLATRGAKAAMKTAKPANLAGFVLSNNIYVFFLKDANGLGGHVEECQTSKSWRPSKLS